MSFVTQYKNHLLELEIESEQPVNLFDGNFGARIVDLLINLHKTANVQYFNVVEISPEGEVRTTVTHGDNQHYEDHLIFPGPEIYWPSEVADGWLINEYETFIHTVTEFVVLFAEFHPTKVEATFF